MTPTNIKSVEKHVLEASVEVECVPLSYRLAKPWDILCVWCTQFDLVHCIVFSIVLVPRQAELFSF